MALKACDSPVSYRIAFKTHAGRLPARYLPGGIWHTVARMVDFYHIGVKRNRLTCLIVLETILPAGVTLTVGGVSIWYFHGGTAWANVGIVVAIGGVIGLAVSPLVLNSLILKDSGPLLIYNYLKTIATTAIFWLISATAFILYLSTFPLALGDTSVLEIGGVYIFSWGIGYIAFFSPQGIGVFEAVAGGLLSDQMSIGGMAVLVSGFRLVTLVSDMIIWGFSLMIPIRRGKPLA